MLRLFSALLLLLPLQVIAAGQPAETSATIVHSAELQKRLVSGKASLADIRQAMSNPNVGELANAIHGLYSMSWHRGAHTVLLAMWRNAPADQQEFPELAWDPIAKPAIRIALASTLNRYYPANPEYRAYLRAHIHDPHEFHRAQAAVGLGLNHDPADVGVIVQLAQEDNVLVAQSAITALALMDEEKARQALVELQKQYAEHPKGRLIREVLQRAYRRGASR